MDIFIKDAHITKYGYVAIMICCLGMIISGIVSRNEKNEIDKQVELENNPDYGFLYSKNMLHIIFVTCAKSNTDNNYVTASGGTYWYEAAPIIDAMDRCMGDSGIKFIYIENNAEVPYSILRLVQIGCLTEDTIKDNWFTDDKPAEDHMLCVIGNGIKPVLKS